MLNLVVIRVEDIEKSKAFYEAIGLNFERHRHGKGLPHLASTGTDITFEIYPAQGKNTADIRLGFLVDNVDVATQQLKGCGGVVLTEAKDSPWGRRAVIKDPDGHTVELCERN